MNQHMTFHIYSDVNDTYSVFRNLSREENKLDNITPPNH